MRYALVYSALVAGASAHGLLLEVYGANNVTMPGLSVADGTPRDCSSNGCGSQADTSIIRPRDVQSGRAGPLGRTQGNGPVDAQTAVMSFMGMAKAPTNKGASDSVGVEDNLSALGGMSRQQRRDEHNNYARQLLGGLLGGMLGGGGGGGAGGQKANYPQETMVGDMAGTGNQTGLPTVADDGKIRMVYRQINQDGAGPLTADIDPTSGGTDASAFQRAQVTQDVPGLPLAGLSLATNMNFPVEVQMPEGMVCQATIGGVENCCVVRIHNTTPAGPFGGSGVVTQTPAARKRAIAYRLKKRFEINREGVVSNAPEDLQKQAQADAEELMEDEE